jgi:hypothetical protein
MNKLKSRKLWVALGTAASIVIAEQYGVDVQPEAIAGIVIVAISYIFGQGIVDKSVISEQVKVAGDVGKVQLELYARNLEKQLAGLTAQIELEENDAEVQTSPFKLGPAPE